MASFLSKGLLGYGGLGGLSGPTMPQGLLAQYDPKQMKQQQLKRGLLQAGIAMLQNGRGSTGEVLGNAFAGGLQGAQQAGDDYFQQSLQYQQLADQQAKIAKQQEQEQKVQAYLDTLPPEERALADANPDAYLEQFLQSKFATGSGANGVFGNVYWDKDGNPYAVDKAGKGMNRLPVEGNAQLVPPDQMAGAKEQAKLGPKGTGTMIDEWFKKGGIRDKTAQATSALESIQQAKQMLQKGIQTGAGAEIINSWRNAGKTLGFDVDESVLQNTQSYQDFIMNTVVPRMAELGGNDSEEELRAMMRTTGGDISRQPEVLQKTLDLIERTLQRNVVEGATVYEQIKPFVGDYNPSYSVDPSAFAPPPASAPPSASAFDPVKIKNKYGLE